MIFFSVHQSASLAAVSVTTDPAATVASAFPVDTSVVTTVESPLTAEESAAKKAKKEKKKEDKLKVEKKEKPVWGEAGTGKKAKVLVAL